MSTLCLQLDDKDNNNDNNDNDACSSKIQSDGGTNYSSSLTVASASVHQVFFPSIELYLLLTSIYILQCIIIYHYELLPCRVILKYHRFLMCAPISFKLKIMTKEDLQN